MEATNDRFKFRAWNKEWGEMVYTTTGHDWFNKRDFAPWLFDVGFSHYPTDEWEIMQCSTLSDREGNLIYEDDIVETELKRVGIIRFSHGIFGVEWLNYIETQDMVGSWGQLHNLRRMDDGFNEKVKVIGNVHENTELCEK